MTFTKERIIEELKASTQNASGMFEISEDTICSLMALLESRADAEPVTGTQFRAVADLYEMQFDDGHTVAFHTDPEKAVQWLNTCDGNKVQEYVKLERLQEVYTRPQPAPVAVPDEMEMDDDFDSAFEHGKAVGWNACRAALLAAPAVQAARVARNHTEQHLDMVGHSGDTNEKGKDGTPINEGTTAAPAVQAEQLSGNTEQVTKCWCHTCRPVTMTDMRFVVCPECGNKRCPHANDHRNACTGSNEPGQEGSAYPDAPKQEAE